MMNRKELERKQKRDNMMAIRRKNMNEFFACFTKYFRPWLHELTRRYIKRGEFPLMSCWLLPSYYQNPDDVEIAVYASMFIHDNDMLIEKVDAFRQLFGNSPYEWFRSRSFIHLSFGDARNHATGGVSNKKLSEFFSLLYDEWPRRMHAMYDIFSKSFGAYRLKERMSMLRLVLATSDGIGQGVWTVEPHYLKCPLTDKVKYLLSTFYPDYNRLEDVDLAIHSFGFERDSDFFYAALAYNELQSKKPNECSLLATAYQKRYFKGNFLDVCHWLPNKTNGILPKLD